MARVAVFYTPGSASPLELAAAAEADGDELVILCLSDDAEARVLVDLRVNSLRFVPAWSLGDDELSRLVSATKPDGVAAFSDKAIPRAAAVASRLAIPYHSSETARALTDKAVQRRRLMKAGVSVARGMTTDTKGLSRAVKQVGMPAIVKPSQASGSAWARLILSETQLLQHIAEAHAEGVNGPWIVEVPLKGSRDRHGSWLAGYASVETFIQDGNYQHLCVTDRLPLVSPLREGGLLLPSLLPHQDWERLFAEADRALSALGVEHGITQTELMLTADMPTVIEVNGRLGGFIDSLMRLASDTDLIRASIATATRLTSIPVPQFKRYALAYILHAPVGSHHVERGPDPRALQALPGVVRVNIKTRRGQRVTPHVGTEARLGTVTLVADEPAQLRQRIGELELLLSSTLSFVGGEFAQ